MENNGTRGRLRGLAGTGKTSGGGGPEYQLTCGGSINNGQKYYRFLALGV
jgi:hypothetical protein